MLQNEIPEILVISIKDMYIEDRLVQITFYSSVNKTVCY